MSRVWIRTLLLVAMGFGFLYFMHHLGFLRIDDISGAFARRPEILFLLALSQVLTAILMMVRYGSLLKVLGLNVPLRQVSSATFVSNALGQWVPGSLAIVEILRVGLMTGSRFAADEDSASQTAKSGIKGRLAIASFADRVIGFLGILTLGALFSIYFASTSAASTQVTILAVISCVGATALLVLPSLCRLRFFKNFGHRFKIRGSAAHLWAGRYWNTALHHFEIVRHDIDVSSRHPRRMVPPLLLSMVSLLLTSLSLYLSAQAIGGQIDFLQIVSAYPLIALSSLLPLGFAGLGGYQLVMASIFSLFSVSPAVVASAGVLQSAMMLLINTLLGLVYARESVRQIRALVNGPISPQQM